MNRTSLALAHEILAKQRAGLERDSDFDLTPYFYDALLPLARDFLAYRALAQEEAEHLIGLRDAARVSFPGYQMSDRTNEWLARVEILAARAPDHPRHGAEGESET